MSPSTHRWPGAVNPPLPAPRLPCRNPPPAGTSLPFLSGGSLNILGGSL
jgi:hypothetical protein